MNKRNPTNADIYRYLGQIDEKVDQVHEQAKKTNGRVNTLEVKQRELEAVERYKKDNPTPSQKLREEGWSAREKTLTAIITTLLAIIAALVGASKL